MQTLAGGRDPLIRVQRGRTADYDEVQRPVIEKCLKVRIGRAAETLAQLCSPLVIVAIERNDFDAGNFTRRARMRFADPATANDADVFYGFQNGGDTNIEWTRRNFLRAAGTRCLCRSELLLSQLPKSERYVPLLRSSVFFVVQVL